MIEQVGHALIAVAFFTKYGLSHTGLTGAEIPKVDAWRVEPDGTKYQVATAGNSTEVGHGFYRYILAAELVTVKGAYEFVFKTTSLEVDQRNLPCMWYVGDNVWDEPTAEHVVAGSFGAFFSTLIASIWGWATRSLPQAAATIGTQLTAAEATGTLTIRKFSYYVYGLTELGDLVDRSAMVLTIKGGPTRIEDDLDSNDLEAILQIEEGVGVVVLNGRTTGFAADGASLVVDDEDTGAITIAIEDATSGLLPAGNYQYDIKKLMVDGTSLVRESGRVKILAGTTKRVV